MESPAAQGKTASQNGNVSNDSVNSVQSSNPSPSPKKKKRINNELLQVIGLIAIPLVGTGLLGYQIWADRNNRQHEVMSQYLDQMTQLITEGDLKTDKPSERTKKAARAITLNALRQLNPERKGQLLRFLHEGGFIGGCRSFDLKTLAPTECVDKAIIDISTAKLDRATSDDSQRSLVLQGAVLKDVVLNGANLQDVALDRANIENGGLVEADLSGAILREAKLQNAKLMKANLSGAQMHSANLERVNFQEAIFGCVERNDKQLCTTLTSARLQGADLRNTNLSAVDLKGAKYDENTKLPPEFIARKQEMIQCNKADKKVECL